MDRQLHDLLDAAVGEPPHEVSAEEVRRRVTRRRVREAAAIPAAVAVLAVAIPVAAATLGHGPAAPGTPGRQEARGPVAYVLNGETGAVTPINTVTNKPGMPIKVAA